MSQLTGMVLIAQECDLPLSKVLKTSGFVASLQKVAKESGDLELDFTLCNNITRSDQVLIITCKRLGHHEPAGFISRLRIKYLSRAPPFYRIFLHVSDVTHVLVAALWSSTYFSPSSQLKYFLQGCAISAILSLSYYILLAQIIMENM